MLDIWEQNDPKHQRVWLGAEVVDGSPRNNLDFSRVWPSGHLNTDITDQLDYLPDNGYYPDKNVQGAYPFATCLENWNLVSLCGQSWAGSISTGTACEDLDLGSFCSQGRGGYCAVYP